MMRDAPCRPWMTALMASWLGFGCSIDPVIPPKMAREIERTAPICRSDAECVTQWRTTQRWLLERANPWGLRERIKDGHVLPKADTLLAMDDRQIIVMDWHRSPGALFSYWIVSATVYGAERVAQTDGDRIGLRYTYQFQGKTYRRTETDDDARTSWGKTVLLFNEYVNSVDKADTTGQDTQAEALSRIHRLERSPLSEQASDDRKWLMGWLLGDPVMHYARYCIDALGPAWRVNYRFAREIESQLLFSGVAIVLEDPSRHADSDQVFLRGIVGALKAYQSILTEHPDADQPSLEALHAKHQAGELADYLRDQPFVNQPDRCLMSLFPSFSRQVGIAKFPMSLFPSFSREVG